MRPKQKSRSESFSFQNQEHDGVGRLRRMFLDATARTEPRISAQDFGDFSFGKERGNRFDLRGQGSVLC